jgi:hypothetical protein
MNPPDGPEQGCHQRRFPAKSARDRAGVPDFRLGRAPCIIAAGDPAIRREEGPMFGAVVGIPELLIILFIGLGLLVVLYPAIRICRRLGFHPLLGVLSLVPVANVVLLWFVAVSEWPIEHARPGRAAAE